MTNSIKILLLIPIILLLFANVACSGDECSATSTAIDDQDSDCIDDASDNCVNDYNPDQFDGDEDGVGEACDSDDSDDTVAEINEDPPSELMDDDDDSPEDESNESPDNSY